jgi:hypothetical protein
VSAGISRPSFFEGQLLKAADLSLGLDYSRGQMARHDRYLHTPGIASGLMLWLDSSTGEAEAKLRPGVAIDGSGREIVVDQEVTLSKDAFAIIAISGDKTSWYPVFLAGRDEATIPPALSSRRCGSVSQPSQTSETYDVSFGRPKDELAETPPSFAPGEGPDGSGAVRVLVGFVQSDGTGKIADAQPEPPTVTPPAYAGVRADEVVARSGMLSLRADKDTTRQGQPALVVDSAKGELRYGMQDALGQVSSPLMWVDAKGDLNVTGSVKSPVTTGVLVESGTIFDGMTIPLPGSVTEDQVKNGQVVLHIVVTPRLAGDRRPPGKVTGTYLMSPLECYVPDPTTRIVSIRERWFDVALFATPAQEISGACDYLVMAYVSGGK